MNKELVIPKWNKPETIQEAKIFIVGLGKDMQEHAYLIGKTLMWIKSDLKHGELGEWIEKNVWFSERTARKFMEFSEECDEKGKLLPRIYELKELKTADSADFKEPPPLPKGKYKIIYADPPWKYGQEQHSKEEQDTVLASHYPSMETNQICALPINELAGENSVLFLWTTSPKLYEAKEVIDAWGFEYKASIIWDKVKHNVG